jgi:hypothetical protein
MNGLHLRTLPQDELVKTFEDRWKSVGILVGSDDNFAKVLDMYSIISAGFLLNIGKLLPCYLCGKCILSLMVIYLFSMLYACAGSY